LFAAGAAEAAAERPVSASSLSSWAVSEGIRRVRADSVGRNVRTLTAVAALGGFLFGYDTGVIR
jgi:hypothetical protein